MKMWKKIVAICIMIMLSFTFCVGSMGSSVEPVGTLVGYIWDEHNNPIENAYVNVSYHGNEYRDGYSDNYGYYQIGDISVCLCQKNVSVSKDGYKNQFKLIGIYPFGLTWCNFTMVKKHRSFIEVDNLGFAVFEMEYDTDKLLNQGLKEK